VAAHDPETQRAEERARWEDGAAGWGRRADRVRAMGMPVSAWMIDHLELQPGDRVLELAAGPGDTGFLAAELVTPGGALLSSDVSEAMLEIARGRAQQLGVDNVEFARLELEWIDLPTASVDAVLCRWGVMLVVDPDAALREIRRVLKPGRRVAVAVWDDPKLNPWATIPTRAFVRLGFAEQPDPAGPGMFAMATPGRLQDALEGAGFVAVVVDAVELERPHPNIEDFLATTLDLSKLFADAIERLSEGERASVTEEITSLASPYTNADGSVLLPGRSLVASAVA